MAENEKNEKNEIKKAKNKGFRNGMLLTTSLILFGKTLIAPLLEESYKKDSKIPNVKYRTYVNKDLLPTNAKAQYVNKDNLIDLVYKNGDVYLQTPEGTFISYENMIQKEKEKIDSLYQVKTDSLKRIFENKLEKDVQ